MLLTILGTCVFRVVWLLVVVPMHHTVETMLLVYPVTWILTAALCVLTITLAIVTRMQREGCPV